MQISQLFTDGADRRAEDNDTVSPCTNDQGHQHHTYQHSGLHRRDLL